jgi:hypothetical protein
MGPEWRSISETCTPVAPRETDPMTTPDGWLQTPDNLLVGSPYRLVVLASGMEPILSEWITIGEKLHALLAALQRPL